MSIVIDELEFEDETDKDGDLKITSPYDVYYISRDGAIQIIDHLGEVFDL